MNENEIQIRVNQELAKIISDPRAMVMYAARALEEADKKLTEIQTHISTDLMPKVEMWDVAMGSNQLFEMSAVAKILNFRNMGRNNLFEYLKGKSLLRYNKEPYQQYVDNKCFKIVEQSFDAGNGVQIYRKTMVTQKGIDYIGKLLLGDGYERNAR